MIRWLLDLVAVALLAVLGGVAILSPLTGPLRIASVLPLILFVPGYAFLSALFPEESSLSQSRRSRRPWSAAEQASQAHTSDESFLLGNVERLGLSVTLSLALVSLIVFGLNFTVGFDARRIAIMLLGFSGSMIIFAIARRIALPPDERFTIELSGTIPMDTMFVGMFALSLLVLVASVGAFAVLSPAGQSMTGFFAVAENESTGNTTMPAVDDAMVDGRSVTLIVNNSEGHTQDYSIVAVRQTVDNGAVADSETVETFSLTVPNEGTKQANFDPPDEGDRLVLYLYRGDVPDEGPSRKSAYKTLRYELSSGGESGSLAPPQGVTNRVYVGLEHR